MGKNAITFGILGLIFGLVIGFTGANYLNRDVVSVNNTPQTPILNPNSQQSQMPPIQNNQTGMLPDVQKVIDKAIAEPENYEAQIKAGEMYSRIQNFDKALEFYQKAQKLKPNDFESNASLGNVYFDARQFVNAATFYQKALEIKPDSVSIISDLGTTYVERSKPDYAMAISQFNKALQLKVNHEPTLYNLGIAHLRNGEKQKAKETLEKLKNSSPESDLIARLENVINK